MQNSIRANPSLTVKPNAKTTRWLLLGLLGGALVILFARSLQPYQVLFANDGPLGFLAAEENRLPARFSGAWYNLAWLGDGAPAAAPTVSVALRMILSPVLYLKIYAPFTLLCVGFSAWLFFRQLRFNPVVCVLGGLAAGLNMHFFSIACWGLGSWNIAVAMAFLALAAVSSPTLNPIWAKGVFAGLAVGMGLMEGFDSGAILSIYVGIYVVVRFLSEDAPVGSRVVRAMGCELLVMIFAGFIAAHTLSTLVQTQIEGVASMEQDVQTKQQRWNAATQWSLPKKETLQLFVPGLFGYRMSQHITQPDHSSAYWGSIGQDPRIAGLGSDDPVVRRAAADGFNVTEEMKAALNTPTRHERTSAMRDITKKSGSYWRYSGSGEFAGVLVSVLALFGLANAFRSPSAYSRSERVAVVFWGIAAVFSLLASWGRFGFVYQGLYHLPYFSTIRNPIKFLHPFHLAWVILAVYGLEMLYRNYLNMNATRTKSFLEHLRQWWQKAKGFDRHWTIFALSLLAMSIVAFILLNFKRDAFALYIEDQAFSYRDVANIVHFAFTQIACFLILLTLSILVVTGIISGAWSGPRINWAWSFLVILLIVDLVRADAPWVRYFDYAEKYAASPVVDFVQDQPYEHRVIGKLEPKGPGSGITPGLGELYFFWIQNDFPYRNIQTLDFAQMPHMPDLDRLFLKNFELHGTDFQKADLFPAIRLWQLTNTRYILTAVSSADLLNARAGPLRGTLHTRMYFDIVRKPGIPVPSDAGDLTVQESDRGAYGIIEFEGTLPRVKLYSNWQVPTNDAETLSTLLSLAFDPKTTVLVSQETPVPAMPGQPLSDAGTATITQYHPKFVQIQAGAKAPCVLLFNDRFAPNWKLQVDGQAAKILRCNYIMRGVYLAPGSHTLEFRYRPPLKSLYVTLCAIAVGMALAGYLIAQRRSVSVVPAEKTAPAPPSPAPPIQEVTAKPSAAPSNPGKKKRKRRKE